MKSIVTGWKNFVKKEEHGYRVRIRNQLIAQYFPEMDRTKVSGSGLES